MATKNEWIDIIEQEEGEGFVLDLLEDVIHQSQQILFKKHIDMQLLPFTVNFARNTIMDIVNFNFFTRDTGNSDPALWIADEEPLHIETDSWARGVIPIRKLENHYKKAIQDTNSPLTEEQYSKLSRKEKLKQKKKSIIKVPKDPEVPLVKTKLTKKVSALAPSAVRVRDTSSYDLNKEIAEENQRTITRAQTTDKDQIRRNLTFDPDGRLIPLIHKNWEQPPKVKVKVIPVEKPKSEAPRPSPREKKRKAQPNSQQGNQETEQFIEDPSLKLPSVIDMIQLKPGVTIREGERIKSLPPLPSEQHKALATSTSQPTLAMDKSMRVIEQIIANSKAINSNE